MTTPLMQIPWRDIQLDGEPIGSGAYADVYTGRWLSADLPVAVKVLRLPYVQGTSLTTFFAEAERIVQLPHHPSIMKLFGVAVEESQSRYCLIMELCEHGSLYHYLRQAAPIPTPERMELARQCVQAIAHLHSLPPPLGPVLHLDVKSPNFLLDAHHRIKCADFGLSKTRIETQRLSASKQLFGGSIAWMAPEMFGGFEKPTQACDVYALAIVLWEIFTEEIPYEDMENTRIVMLVQQGLRLPIPPSLPAAIETLITSAWHQEPAKRPTAAHMLQALIEAQQSQAPTTRTPDVVYVHSWEIDKQLAHEKPVNDGHHTSKLPVYTGEVNFSPLEKDPACTATHARPPDEQAMKVASTFSAITVEPSSLLKHQRSTGESVQHSATSSPSPHDIVRIPSSKLPSWGPVTTPVTTPVTPPHSVVNVYTTAANLDGSKHGQAPGGPAVQPPSSASGTPPQPAPVSLQQIHLSAPQATEGAPQAAYRQVYTPHAERTSLVEESTPHWARVHGYDKSSGLAVSGTLHVGAAHQAAFDTRANAALVRARSDVALSGKEAEVRLLQAQRSKESLSLDPVKKIHLQLDFERQFLGEVKHKLTKRRWKCCLGYVFCCPIYFCCCSNGQYRARARLKQDRRECKDRIRELEKQLVLAKHVQDPNNQQELQLDSVFTRNLPA